MIEISDAEIQDLEECSEMFDFCGFTPAEDKQLIAEVIRLRQERAALTATVEECRELFREWKDEQWCPKNRIVAGFAAALGENADE